MYSSSDWGARLPRKILQHNKNTAEWRSQLCPWVGGVPRGRAFFKGAALIKLLGSPGDTQIGGALATAPPFLPLYRSGRRLKPSHRMRNTPDTSMVTHPPHPVQPPLPTAPPVSSPRSGRSLPASGARSGTTQHPRHATPSPPHTKPGCIIAIRPGFARGQSTGPSLLSGTLRELPN